jgi:taurine dioxygenase
VELEALSTDPESLGRAVRGIDLAQGVSDDVVAALSRALFEHGLLLLRDQRVTPAAQVAFARLFGPLDLYPDAGEIAGFREIYAGSNVPGRGHPGYPAYWHQDGVNFPTLPLISVYHMVDVPESHAHTLFISAERALSSMPGSLRAALAKLSIESVAGVTHAMLRTHPVTGRSVPCIRTRLPRAIVGLNKADSRAFLEQLEQFLDQQPHVYRHAWRSGDVLLTDNGSVLHKAVRPDSLQPRTIHRVTESRLAGAGEAPA